MVACLLAHCNSMQQYAAAAARGPVSFASVKWGMLLVSAKPSRIASCRAMQVA
jgi:hypothetical protein